MSDEDKKPSAPERPVSASISIGRDYDIIDEEAVHSSSPKYRSIPSTGQVIPLPESDREQDVSQEGGSQEVDNITTTTASCKLVDHASGFLGKPTTSAETSNSACSGTSELNPFAHTSRRIDGTVPPPVPPHADQADALRIVTCGRIDERSGLEEPEGMLPEEQISNHPALPRVNCPEKIIICLDISSEVNRVPFVSRDFTKYQPLDLIKRALNIFVKTKSKMNPLHEYALVILQDSATWVFGQWLMKWFLQSPEEPFQEPLTQGKMQDFTTDVDDFINVMLDLTSETRETEIFDLTTLFDTILDKVDLPFVEDTFVLPPPHIVRTLFVYGRSNCVPEFCDGREAQRTLSSSPYFFFDVFYVHEPPSVENYCKEVYDVFLDLDSNNTSYIHEVGRNTTHLHNKMAMLLGHPLQRPVQMQASHSLNLSEV